MEIEIDLASQRTEYSDKTDVIMQKINLEVIQRESLHVGQGKGDCILVKLINFYSIFV